jgi:hypothetical protein
VESIIRSGSIRTSPYNRRFIPSLEAFGERQTLLEWSHDPRCVVKYGTLAHRISQGWDPEQAITRPVEHRERTFTRPKKMITAFGETKSVTEWSEDSRVVVVPNVFLRRIQHGWSAESSLTAPVSSSRGKRDGNAMQYEAFGEKKTLREWAQDPRCQVSEMTLRKNIQAGMEMEQAFQYRRKPGRHFIGAHEDFSGEVNEVRSALTMMADGGELWVYTMVDANRISLIHKDVRHTISEELFRAMHDNNYVAKSFETDTIKNFELTADGKSAVI